MHEDVLVQKKHFLWIREQERHVVPQHSRARELHSTCDTAFKRRGLVLAEIDAEARAQDGEDLSERGGVAA